MEVAVGGGPTLEELLDIMLTIELLADAAGVGLIAKLDELTALGGASEVADPAATGSELLEMVPLKLNRVGAVFLLLLPIKEIVGPMEEVIDSPETSGPLKELLLTIDWSL